jgi:large subunit ribosomal protein L35
MSKMKSKSSAKKRFRTTATGKVRMGQPGKRHGMIKRTPEFVRSQRGSRIMHDSDAKKVIRYYLHGGQ